MLRYAEEAMQSKLSEKLSNWNPFNKIYRSFLEFGIAVEKIMRSFQKVNGKHLKGLN